RPSAPMRVSHRFEFDAVARDAAHELPRAAADGVLAELLLAHTLQILLGHDRAFGCNRPAERGRQPELRLMRVDAYGQIIEDVDAGKGAARPSRGRPQPFPRHPAVGA